MPKQQKTTTGGSAWSNVRQTSDAGREYRGKNNNLKARSTWHKMSAKAEAQRLAEQQRLLKARANNAPKAQASPQNQALQQSIRQANYKQNLPKARGGVQSLMIQAAIDDLVNRPVADGTLDAARRRGDLDKKRK
jgi:hypothetical protein